ncbi:Hpt domain-containing protein [Picosynechococcus sp. NKBG042902]|uniref:Hpt domain-containing protein n=1 Tax=Picosynechococcus sp. NKBG042902 TaxID=490193 RepID=UPI0004AA9CF2|nr:Hpt domain-containing protein [Picosynechococcus sp. NKBG042902]
MDAASQQKILGYFIEEAKEHLETLEQGILELSEVVDDTERVNELFRAAHSVKGGAAMLGYTSIQKTAHRLEDAFKVFKDNTITVDETLKSLFLNAYDVLQELLEKLQSPFGLQEEEIEKIMAEADPQFSELQKYLDRLAVSDNRNPVVSPEVAPPPLTPAPMGSPTATGFSFGPQVRGLLQQMLGLFRQDATPECRQQLQKLCIELAKLNKKAKPWQKLLKASHKAIANPAHRFSTLAPIVLKSIKEAADHLERNEPERISLPTDLKNLAIAQLPYILIPTEPKEAAQILNSAFSEAQLAQLVQALKHRA